MALSVRERVLAAFAALLGTVAAPNLSGTITVFRARRKDVPDGQLPALVMRASPVAAEQMAASHTRNLERVAVVGIVKADTDTGLDQALADLGAAVHKAVEADSTLGGLVVDITLSEADQAAADGDGIGGVGDTLAVYLIEYWTRPGDPYALAP